MSRTRVPAPVRAATAETSTAETFTERTRHDR
jgi:hypothetical protein